jgi:hypothetical protein
MSWTLVIQLIIAVAVTLAAVWACNKYIKKKG